MPSYRLLLRLLLIITPFFLNALRLFNRSRIIVIFALKMRGNTNRALMISSTKSGLPLVMIQFFLVLTVVLMTCLIGVELTVTKLGEKSLFAVNVSPFSEVIVQALIKISLCLQGKR
jgi:hypothetical protein